MNGAENGLISSSNPTPQAEMNENANTTTTTTTTTAPAAEPEWECSVCYGDGRRTAKMTLPCDHPICLGCYSRMRDAQPDYHRTHNRAIPCPLCRTPIVGNTEPTPQEVEEFKRIAGIARATRETLQQIERQKVAREQDLERQLEYLRTATSRYEGAYEEYEPWTRHRPELANLHARVEAPVQAPIQPQHNAAVQAAIDAQANGVNAREFNDAALRQQAIAAHRANAPAAQPQPQPQPNAADRCPGCHTLQPDIRLRTMGDGRRLRRCRNCHRNSRNR